MYAKDVLKRALRPCYVVWRPLAIALLILLVGLQPPAQAQGSPIRRVNVPYFAGEVNWTEEDWTQAAVFWFGKVDLTLPGRNYVDVRVAYSDEVLAIFANVVDYYIWYDPNATPSTDLTQYEAMGVYLDTAHDEASAPQQDDYFFLSGLHLYENAAYYRREARGNGAAWDASYSVDWEDGTYASWWCNPGPNSNDCGRDFGWWSYLYIPWSAVGRSGPPASGETWGLGVILYDHDNQPPAGAVSPQFWPEAFSSTTPSTWGEVVFSPDPYQPLPATPQDTVMIRRGEGTSLVEDAWVGGGGTCSGGHEGDPDGDNHGDDTNLFVADQELIADFPCFSKSYLRFGLDSIPSGKVILSATLTLHHYSNAQPSDAQPSLIQLFTVDNVWAEDTLTWNSAPLAQENLSRTWVEPVTADPDWPGIPYDWDATQAVAQAYAAGEPLSIALYSADTPMHSSKYFTSSETGDWNAVGRPTLRVLWGDPVVTVEKQASPGTVTAGEVVTYSIRLTGSGQSMTLTDDLPQGVSAPGSIQASEGSASYNAGLRRVTWQGTPAIGQPVVVTFSVNVEVGGPTALHNTAVLTDPAAGVLSDTVTVLVDPLTTKLPLIIKGG
ncbi:MAG: hypothetical protein A2Y73_05650 [Chloroflexi bacterium RBG_13_56_8]|nr:MAG: hypothetical protein A2Y73_05650 [Chloroflexi bacterium RBG_13_56_8]